MAYIKGVSYYLPETVVANEDLITDFPGCSVDKVAKKVGVYSRHIAAIEETAGDMAEKAAIKLFNEFGIDSKSIDFLLFCSQSPDYFMPSTSCVIQSRLGIPISAGAFDFNLGCSGYVYGLAIANSFVESGLARNVLLLTGDTLSKYLHPLDLNRLLFGDAASATLVSANNGMASIGEFVTGTDGSGFEDIIIRNGGNRNKNRTGETITGSDGIIRFSDYFDMNGEAVFDFTIERVPKMVDDCLEKNHIHKEEVDLYVFHQANKYMLNTLRKLITLPQGSFLIDLAETGNTTSSSVPIGLVNSLNKGILHKNMTVMIAGFGVGLSWASGILRF